ncbi:TPA: hypothetical protein QIY15_001179 [Klebsiella aerogenes]|nr:hypothetical protein [Klebsiella aerogenes]
MTDITELAQSLKAAAEKAIGAHERLAAYPYGEIIDISQHEGEQIDIDITDINEFHEEASPANVLALVEVLEKVQRANGYLREQSSDWEREAIGNFEDCEEMSARVEELESQRKLAFAASNRWADKFREAEKRIAELEESHAQAIQSRDHYKRISEEGLKKLAESRTVTVKLPKRSVGEVMHMSGFSRDYAEGWCSGNDNAIHEMRAAGIKVEAE